MCVRDKRQLYIPLHVSDKDECFSLDRYGGDILAIGLYLFFFSLLVLQVSGLDGISASSGKPWDPILALIITLIVHEVLHAVPPILSGVGVRFGYARIGKLPVFYVGMKKPVSRNLYLLIAVSPLLSLHVIPLLSLAGLWKATNLLKMIYVLNTIGSSGDILMFLSALRLKSEEKVWDTGVGFEGCLPKPYSDRISLVIKAIAVILLLIIIVNMALNVEIIIVKE
ncbi:MAG: hypothetical protein DRJ35_07770 [Thermoprotei archaeon]|nr:MAG: hypothetical protein DRJ35_07770 [Thermoprotei archaeon]